MEGQRESQHLHWEFSELGDIRLPLRGRTLIVVVILFAILVLSTLLFFYARRICHSRQNARSSTSHDPPGAQPPPSRGLDLVAIEAMPVILVENGGVGSTECCICLAGFEDGEKVKVLPQCQHAFHCKCVDRWLHSESSCPLCRASLRAESELIKIVTDQ